MSTFLLALALFSGGLAAYEATRRRLPAYQQYRAAQSELARVPAGIDGETPEFLAANDRVWDAHDQLPVWARFYT
jgi:hypothetical protein